MANKHMPYDLAQMQSLPLEAKIIMTQQRIRQWYEHWDGQVYVSFSGGKDSTVLKHIVDGMYDDVPAVFVNTGLEYPEIQRFVNDVKAGKWDCFNSDVEIVRPEMRFDEVLKRYGYPVLSKDLSHRIMYYRKGSPWALNLFNGLHGQTGEPNEYAKSRYGRWKYVADSPFEISSKCCDVMKKKPLHEYVKRTGRKNIMATLACESNRRLEAWMKTGCNAFESANPRSAPMSFWTEQDVFHYIKKFNVPYCPVYGDIVIDQKVDGDKVIEGQINLIDYLECYDQEDKLKTTGCNRTGCIFCMFGCHLEKEPNRFQRLKETHPRQYEYCIGGGEMVDGKWQPNKEGLGLGKVLDYINVKY